MGCKVFYGRILFVVQVVLMDAICSLTSFMHQYFIHEDRFLGKHLDLENVHHFIIMNLFYCGMIYVFMIFLHWPHFNDFLLVFSISLLLFVHSNLLSNPYVCDCHLAWLGQWLKKTRVVSGNPRCQKPAFLKEIPIQDVATPDFTCDSKLLFRPALILNTLHFCWSFWHWLYRY